MKKIFQVLAACCLAVTIFSCSKCHKGDGPIVTIDKGITTPFTEVQVQGDFEVVLKTGSYDVNLITNQNIGGYIDVYVSGNTLHVKIKNDECIKKYDKLKVEITAPYYSKVRSDGSGFLENEGTLSTSGKMYVEHYGSGFINLLINADSVYSRMEGSGKLTVRGNTTGHFAFLEGSGLLEAGELHAVNATASLNGSGALGIHASNSLIAGVNGSGAIIYSGNPVTVDKSVNGSGAVVAK